MSAFHLLWLNTRGQLGDPDGFEIPTPPCRCVTIPRGSKHPRFQDSGPKAILLMAFGTKSVNLGCLDPLGIGIRLHTTILGPKTTQGHPGARTRGRLPVAWLLLLPKRSMGSSMVYTRALRVPISLPWGLCRYHNGTWTPWDISPIPTQRGRRAR